MKAKDQWQDLNPKSKEDKPVNERRADTTEVAQSNHQSDPNTLLGITTGVVRSPTHQDGNGRIGTRGSEERADILELRLLRVRLCEQDREADNSQGLRDQDERSSDPVPIREAREDEGDNHGENVRRGRKELGIGSLVPEIGDDAGKEEGESVDDDGITIVPKT